LEVIDTDGQEGNVNALLVQYVANARHGDDDDQEANDEQPWVVRTLNALAGTAGAKQKHTHASTHDNEEEIAGNMGAYVR
jgi:hypothetical protein